ncbi:hypothetical protein ElyMa_004212200 [Elysia marginata]|uniref:Uncharacterized protein n=1 Tax=Elysia marginata TaxID=1093978 RepID=A0AAV4GP01_9GAST|nr:hypothetical protein ElyMa_004212200 [Elysia marginata]
MITGTNHLSDISLILVNGFVNGTNFTVLRDTGSFCVGIRSPLLTPPDYLNQQATCVLFDGSEHTFLMTRVFINTPYFTGNVNALEVSLPIADSIIGNIPGASDLTYAPSFTP